MPCLLSKLVHELRSLDASLQALVYENYSKFISATDTIRNMGQAMNDRSNTNLSNDAAQCFSNSGPTMVGGLEMMSVIRSRASQITSRVSATDDRLRNSRIRIEELSSIRRMIQKMMIFAALPEKIKKLVTQATEEKVLRTNGSRSKNELRSCILLASKYIIDAMPIVRLVLPLPVPMAASARELLNLKEDCEDELIRIISEQEDESNPPGMKRDDTSTNEEKTNEYDTDDIDEISDVLVKLITAYKDVPSARLTNRRSLNTVTRFSHSKSSIEKHDIVPRRDTDTISSRIYSAELDRAKRFISRYASNVAIEGMSHHIRDTNQRVVPYIHNASKRWSVLFSSIAKLQQGNADVSPENTGDGNASEIVIRLRDECFDVYIKTVRDLLTSKTDSGYIFGHNKTIEDTLGILQEHCKCLQFVFVAGLQVNDIPKHAESSLGNTLPIQVMRMIREEILRILHVMKQEKDVTFNSRILFPDSSLPSAEGHLHRFVQEDEVSVHKKDRRDVVPALEMKIDAMLLLLQRYCVLLTTSELETNSLPQKDTFKYDESSSAYDYSIQAALSRFPGNGSHDIFLVDSWLNDFQNAFTDTVSTLLKSIPSMITTAADLLRQPGTGTTISESFDNGIKTNTIDDEDDCHGNKYYSSEHNFESKNLVPSPTSAYSSTGQSWHESLDALSKLARSLSTRISSMNCRNFTRDGRYSMEVNSNMLLNRYLLNADVLFQTVSDALTDVSTELRAQFMVYDREEEAQRIVRELQSGLKEKIQGASGNVGRKI